MSPKIQAVSQSCLLLSYLTVSYSFNQRDVIDLIAQIIMLASYAGVYMNGIVCQWMVHSPQHEY